MSGVDEPVVIQPNGAVGVPVSPAAAVGDAAAATTSIVPNLAATSVIPISPPPVDAALSTQALAPDPKSTLDKQVIAPGITTATAEVSPPAVDPATEPAPAANLASSSSEPVDVIPAATTSSTSTAIPTFSSPQAPAPVAPAAVETSPLPAPPAESPAATTTAAVRPPAAAVVEADVTSAESSDPPPRETTSLLATATNTAPGAIGDTNIFAPAPVESESTSSTPPASTLAVSSTLPSELAHQFSTTASSTTSPISSDQQGSTISSQVGGQSSATRPSSVHHGASTSASNESAVSSSETSGSANNKSEGATTTPSDPTPTDQKPEPTTTFVSGSVTYTGAAAVSAAEFAHSGGGEKKEAKDGMSSFAIIGIVGGILVFFILLYIGWFQWRKRRSRDDAERLDDEDYAANEKEFDPYGLAREKHSGFDFIDQPLSSRRSDRYKSTMTAATVNPFSDPNDQPKRGRGRETDTEYVETWYSDPGDAGLGTARSQAMPWYDDRRPSYIDGPQSIYHETNDPSDPFNQGPEAQDRPRSVPEAPPVPPLPVAYRKSTAASRPRTDFSYGDFYGGYDEARSRPGTQFTQYTHDQQPQTATTVMDSPNTAAMLPWLHSADSPPLPTPADPRSLPTHQPKNGFGSQPRMPLRGPVAAAMAQTPVMQDRGCQGVIPTFR